MLWTSAFVDLAPDCFVSGVDYWRKITGYALSPARGERAEFATLVPPDGDPYLRVQRLGAGPGRVHLDLHVPDPRAAAERAVTLGATIVRDRGYVVMSSPGGLPFCFVTHRAGIPPRPTDWGDGLVSVVDQVCLDIPGSRFESECAFWEELTGWEARSSSSHSEFSRLVAPAGQPLGLLLQRLGEHLGQVRAHLDLSTTNRAAETVRHVGHGGRLLEVFDRWTVLLDPTGAPYCITDRNP